MDALYTVHTYDSNGNPVDSEIDCLAFKTLEIAKEEAQKHLASHGGIVDITKDAALPYDPEFVWSSKD